jgi:hypothetical protein
LLAYHQRTIKYAGLATGMVAAKSGKSENMVNETSRSNVLKYF